MSKYFVYFLWYLYNICVCLSHCFHSYLCIWFLTARGRYVATAPSNSAILRVLDVVKEEFVHNKRMFPAPKTDDDDELTIDAVAISPDKKSIYISNYIDNDIHICHLKTMAKLRVLKGKPHPSFILQNRA